MPPAASDELSPGQAGQGRGRLIHGGSAVAEIRSKSDQRIRHRGSGELGFVRRGADPRIRARRSIRLGGRRAASAAHRRLEGPFSRRPATRSYVSGGSWRTATQMIMHDVRWYRIFPLVDRARPPGTILPPQDSEKITAKCQAESCHADKKRVPCPDNSARSEASLVCRQRRAV